MTLTLDFPIEKEPTRSSQIIGIIFSCYANVFIVYINTTAVGSEINVNAAGHPLREKENDECFAISNALCDQLSFVISLI